MRQALHAEYMRSACNRMLICLKIAGILQVISHVELIQMYPQLACKIA